MPHPNAENKKKEFCCEKCHKSFSRSSLLLLHQSLNDPCFYFEPYSLCLICCFGDSKEAQEKVYESNDEMLTHRIHSQEDHHRILTFKINELTSKVKPKHMQTPEDAVVYDQLQLLEGHFSSWAFQPKVCPNNGCSELISEQRLLAHQKICPHAIDSCKHCTEQIKRSEMELHFDACEKAEAKCERCGMTFSSKRYLQIHQSTTVACLKFAEPIPCYICEPHPARNIQVGTTTVYHTADELIKHLNDSNTQVIHIQLLAGRIESLESRLEVQAQQQTEELKQYVEKRNEPLLRTVADTVLEMKKIEEKVESATTQADSLVNAMREVHKGAEQIASLKSKMESIERVFGRSGFEAPDVLSSLKASVKTLEEGYIGMDKRLKDIELATHNGKLVWKIKNYKKLKLDAQKGRVFSLYSHPFYSSEAGYKMCCRVYLNGDGVGRGHFLSIFFVVMKGEYDNLLQWPFGEQVTFKLICPSNQLRNKTVTYMPDGSSNSFHKPQDNMNTPIGFPQFLEQSAVEDPSNGYLVNDCIYVGIAVSHQSRFA